MNAARRVTGHDRAVFQKNGNGSHWRIQGEQALAPTALHIHIRSVRSSEAEITRGNRQAIAILRTA